MKSASSWTERWSSSGHDRRPNRMAAKTRSISRAIAAVCAGAACVAALAGCGTSTAGEVPHLKVSAKPGVVPHWK